MKLYDSNGYLNIPEILRHEATFIFIYGGRGTGKTYGTLKNMIEDHHKFIYLRRLAAQVDIVKKDDMQPFKTLNRDMGWDIRPFLLINTSQHFMRQITIKMVNLFQPERVKAYLRALVRFQICVVWMDRI